MPQFHFVFCSIYGCAQFCGAVGLHERILWGFIKLDVSSVRGWVGISPNCGNLRQVSRDFVITG